LEVIEIDFSHPRRSSDVLTGKSHLGRFENGSPQY
jgi:hypothetical protein